MATQTIVDGVTLSQAAWGNDVDTATYSWLTGVAGTNTITANGPANATLTSGKAFFRFIASGTNSGATTINITPSGGAALGAKNIFFNGSACVGGEIVSGATAVIMYDGTQFQLIVSSRPATLNIEDQTLTGGVRVTSKSITPGNFTADPGDRPLQYITNGGAFTITAPANDGSMMLLITNDASAGAITWSGFQVSGDTGDALTTTDGHDFLVSIVRINSIATYFIKALQ
jgi:hypothetical protein